MIEIIPVQKINATVSVPGSKYIANRVLLIAALADGISTIQNVPDNDDINQVISVLRELGVKIEKNHSTLLIEGKKGKFQLASTALQVKDSGTLLRFLAALSSLIPGKTTITGSKQIQERPIKDLLNSLRELGIKCMASEDGYPPVEIQGGTFPGGITTIPGSVSSQYVSALLLAAPYAKKNVIINLQSELVSKNYVDMTIALMNHFGVQVLQKEKMLVIESGQTYQAREFTIPADWSSASYFLAAAAMMPGKVTIQDVDFNFQQGEAKFVDLLEKMGCNIFRGKDWITVEGTRKLIAIEVNMSTMPDVVQTLSVVAACAEGTTKITGIGHLKYKECNRLEKTAQELSKAGVKIKATNDELWIAGSSDLKPAVIETHNDHRMAMSLALLGLKKAGIKIQNPEVVKKSFPNYWERLSGLGVQIIGTGNIILIGYRGTGKTTIAKLLAQKLSKNMVGTDEEIAKDAGDISAFVQAKGWKKFREKERELIQKLKIGEGIIDCDGGVVEEEKNIAELKKRGTIIWLKANAPAIREKIKDSNRPALTSKSSIDEAEEVLLRREPLYQKAAGPEINTKNKNPEQAAEEIITVLGLKPRLCIPIVAETVEEALQDLRKAEQHADLTELRLDYFRNISEQGLRELIASKTKPMIATCRGKQTEKRELLLKAVEFGAEFIDLDENEKSMMKELRKNGETRIILSFHYFAQTPSLKELNQKYEEMRQYSPDFIKIVATANSINDNFTIFRFLQEKKNCLAFCMGVQGVLSRILAPKYGSFLTFAALDEKKTSAPGQITVAEMKKYNISAIDEKTEIYGVVGAAAEHSHSPKLHNTFFQKSLENARFLPFKVEEKELKEFIDNLRKYNFKGAAITMPHKVAVMQYLNEIDETAARIGAVNTIINKRGKLVGYNTDSYGALRALQEKIKVNGKNVLVLGAGGAARAVVYGLQKEGARVTISNRTMEKAQQLAGDFHAEYISSAEAEKRSGGYDIIINATSAGMGLQEEETPLRTLPKEKVVVDIVSYPAITKFIKLAQQNKCTVITGEKMLFYQAVQQYYLWRGKELNSEVLEHARQLFR